MGSLVQQAEKIAEDLRHGKKLGEKSATNLVQLVLSLAQVNEDLARRVRTLENDPSRVRLGPARR